MIAKYVALPRHILDLTPGACWSARMRELDVGKKYQIAELLIKPVSCSATGFLVRNLSSDPVTQVLFVFPSELCPPAQRTKCERRYTTN